MVATVPVPEDWGTSPEEDIMRTRTSPGAAFRSLVALAAAATGFSLVVVAPADAGDREVIRRGSCSGSADWKIKAKEEDGRIEVEAEVDSNRNGQTWHWRLLHNGSVTARGTKTTGGRSGSFEVRRVVVDLAGADHLKLRARKGASGESCRGAVTY
jgi:hypothetical protein